MTVIGRKSANHAAVDKLQYIDAVLHYMEQHLCEDMRPDDIAKQHFVSLSQLYRDFYAYTGHSVKEYIRKRRISNACEKIKCSEIPLAIIAGESGYQTQQAFHKQFKSIVGMTPLAYQQGDTYFYFYPYPLNGISLTVKVARETIPECAITRFYDSCLHGIEDKAIASLGKITGRVFGRNGKQIGSQFCYEVMTEQVTSAGVSTPVGKTDLYAACTVNYNEAEINDGWNYLYNTWLSASMFEESGNGYFEEYLFRNGNNPRGGETRGGETRGGETRGGETRGGETRGRETRGRETHKLKLYLPVKKCKTQQHITIASIPEMTFVIAQGQGYNAERKASEKVMAFLQEHHPLLIRNTQRFYVCIYDDICACGLECGDGFKLSAQHMDSGLEMIHIPAGRYAVLPDDRLGDMRTGAAKIDLWLQNNSIAHGNEPVFAVYETLNGKYDNENVRMEIYKRLNFDING